MKEEGNKSIPISPNILRSIASSYLNIYRVFMEFIINSVDQATRRFFDINNNKYTKEIIITITHTGKKADDSVFTFEDNCEGLKNSMLDSLYKHFYIGNSEKVNDKNTVGKFGFGMMAFLAICSKMIVSVKTTNFDGIDNVLYDSKTFDTPGLSAVPINISSMEYNGDIKDSFTRIILSEFKPDKFKEFNFLEFKSEIETHLDPILRRENFKIKLIDNNGREHICKPFNYDSIDSQTFVRKLTELRYMYYKRGKNERVIPLGPYSVKIFFKVTNNKILNMRPYFIINGVRIEKISKFEELRTNQKGLTYSHPNLIGYIDVTGIVEPNITRDGFEPNEKLKPLFYTLIKLEPEIKEYIASELRSTTSTSTKLLETKLNEALVKYLKKKNNRVNKKSESAKCKDVEFEKTKVMLMNIGENKTIILSKKENMTSKVDDIKKGRQNKLSELEILIPKDIITSDNEEDAKTNNLFTLNIDDVNEPDTDESNKPIRSKFTGSEITIYQKHSSFQNKLDTIDDELAVSASLITYLATEIVMHYKINFTEGDEPQDTSKVLNDFISSVYEFEGYLKDLKGKRLIDLN